MINSIITGSGSYVPERIVKNTDFLDHDFFGEDGKRIQKTNEEIITKFKEITEIEERRYAPAEMSNSEMASIAAQKAVDAAGIDPNELDYVLVAHNFGDIFWDSKQVDIMPSMASRVKKNLKITNNKCKPYDVNFGCPGWVEGVIMGHQYIQAGIATKLLIVGSDMLSRATDPHDRSTMIFADGAGAIVLEAKESDVKAGILHHETISDSVDESGYLTNGLSLNPDFIKSLVNIQMKGRKVYEYALKKVPALVKRAIDNAGLDITDIKKVLLHQANAKMDHAMVDRLFRLYGIKEYDTNVAPMTVQKLGNTSVATIPTMYDLIVRGEMEGHTFESQGIMVFASVGAGMSINALIYQTP